MIYICTMLFDLAYIIKIDFHADFLAKLFVSKMVVFSKLGVWGRRTKHPCVPGAEGTPGRWDIQCEKPGKSQAHPDALVSLNEPTHLDGW